MTYDELIDEQNALEVDLEYLETELTDMDNNAEIDTPEYEQLQEEINDVVNDLSRIERELQVMDQ